MFNTFVKWFDYLLHSDENGEEHAAFFTDESPDVALIVPREVLEIMVHKFVPNLVNTEGNRNGNYSIGYGKTGTKVKCQEA